MNIKEIKRRRKYYKSKIREIDQTIREEFKHIDDAQWEIPGLIGAQNRKKLYEKRYVN